MSLLCRFWRHDWERIGIEAVDSHHTPCSDTLWRCRRCLAQQRQPFFRAWFCPERMVIPGKPDEEPRT